LDIFLYLFILDVAEADPAAVEYGHGLFDVDRSPQLSQMLEKIRR
jgi:hypothetical protein